MLPSILLYVILVIMEVDARVQHRNYMRQNYICTEGGSVRCVKRPRPDKCELCGSDDTARRLYYHHWDNESPHWGIWVCWKCHRACEVFERGLDGFSEKYRDIKKNVMSTWEGVPDSTERDARKHDRLFWKNFR